MEPEEVDKIFKDRFTGLPAVPSADAWMRLQQKMDPPKKGRSMWIYYAAASVSVLLISVFLFLNSDSTKTDTLAQVKKPKIERMQPNTPAVPAPITPNITVQQEPVVAQTRKTTPSINLKKDTTVKSKGSKENKGATYALENNTRIKKSLKQNKVIESTPAASTTPSAPASAVETMVALNSEKTTDKNIPVAGLVEITIKRDTPIEHESSEFKENLARKTNLLKNIYKQARNLKNGEQVELASLGINTDKIHSEKKELKDKITKVISL